jgi:hypothetical protein
MSKPIGGFLPLHLPKKVTGNFNFYHLWHITRENSVFFHNARSCLHYLLSEFNAAKIWLPAYICSSVVEAVSKTQTTINFYPLSSTLSPDIHFLQQNLKAGDYVLAVDYFGSLPHPHFLEWVQQRRDIHWIEDRAQAMLPSRYPWGDWVLYSPRKLIGIPDGGILMKMGPEKLPQPYYAPITSSDFMKATLLRFEDREEKYNAQWYQAFVASENAMQVSNLAMSRFSRDLLAILDPSDIIKTRQTNYNYLFQALHNIAFMKKAAQPYVPLGFPIRLPNAEPIWEALCQQRIFAQRHWLDLPSKPQQFPTEHQLAQELLTLPCDHRYSICDMDIMIKSLQPFL